MLTGLLRNNGRPMIGVWARRDSVGLDIRDSSRCKFLPVCMHLFVGFLLLECRGGASAYRTTIRVGPRPKSALYGGAGNFSLNQDMERSMRLFVSGTNFVKRGSVVRAPARVAAVRQQQQQQHTVVRTRERTFRTGPDRYPSRHFHTVHLLHQRLVLIWEQRTQRRSITGDKNRAKTIYRLDSQVMTHTR
jgi:hypothetical protein